MDKNNERKVKKRSYGSLLGLIKYIFKYKFMILTVFVVVIVSNLMALLIPYLTGVIVDSIDVKGAMVNFTFIAKNGLYILFIALVTWGLSALQNMLMLKTGQNVVLDLRRDVFAKLVKLPVSYFDNNTKGNIISIVSTDIDNISESVSADMITLLTGFVTVIGAMVMMLSISPIMTLIFVVTVPMMFFGARIISKRARILFRNKKVCYGKLCGYSEEMITAQKTVKVYGIEEYNKEKFFQLSKDLKDTGTTAEFVSSIMMPTMNGINNLNFTLICVIGAFLVLSGKISIGNISTFVLYSKKFAAPIIDTANIINMLQVSLAACDRVFSILNYPEEVDEAKNSDIEVPEFCEIKGNVAFEDVCFSYNDDVPVLKNISFNAKAGEKIAVVGATGSGKTTIISLLLRFYDVNSGKITIDGMDLRDLPIKRLRQYFALVLQDSWLFEGSVLDNIAYAAKDTGKDETSIKEMCKKIDIEDFIESLPNGYDSILQSESGLSAGQKQLLNIARAFMCDPPIFILDEATSYVDTMTEEKIKSVTNIVTQGKTSFIIAHRLSTILGADKILVMQDGCIMQVGPHRELISEDGIYKRLYESQFALE